MDSTEALGFGGGGAFRNEYIGIVAGVAFGAGLGLCIRAADGGVTVPLMSVDSATVSALVLRVKVIKRHTTEKQETTSLYITSPLGAGDDIIMSWLDFKLVARLARRKGYNVTRSLE